MWSGWSSTWSRFRHDEIPSRFLPLVETLEAKHESLWSCLGFSHQKRLLTLLDQMEPAEQDLLLKVMNQVKEQRTPPSWFPSTRWYDEESLLNILTSVCSIDRLNLLRLLESMDRQEQRKLMRVMDGLQPNRCYSRIGCPYYIPEVQTVWRLINILPPVDRSRLLNLLDGQDFEHRCKLLTVLERSCRQREIVELMHVGRLKPWEQQLLIGMLNELDSPEEMSELIRELFNSPLRISDISGKLEPQQQQQLERVVGGRGHLQKYMMANVMDRLKPCEQQVLLRVLDALDSEEQDEVILVVLRFHGLGYLSSGGARLPFKPPVLMYLLRCEQHLPLDQSALQHCMEKLNPLQYKELLKSLDMLDQSELGIFSMLWKLKEYKGLLLRLVLLFVRLLSVYLFENGPQGSFRNLLLDGWWLEFWEVVLLAAGDVERNPGPRRMKDEELSEIDNQVLGKDAVFHVYDAVYDCRAKWRNLCLALGVSHGDLSAIDEKRRGDTDACLQDGLSLWLQGKYGRPTWRMLVDAVANTAGGDDHTLALEIAEKHQAYPREVIGGAHAREDRRRFEEMSSSFNSMYRSVIPLLRNVDVLKVKECLRYLADPECFDKLCVPPRVYERAATTKDLLDRLCPQYINPGNTFVLEEIVSKCGSRRCKRLVQEYVNRFM